MTRVLGCLLILLTLVPGCERAEDALIGIESIEAEALWGRLAAGHRLVLLDVRDVDEFAEGHIAGSLQVELSGLFGWPGGRGATVDEVVAICAHGRRSKQAAAIIAGRGARRVWSLRGGMARWRALGYPEARGVVPGTAARPLPPRVVASRPEEVALVAALGATALSILIALAAAVRLRGWRDPGGRLVARGMIAVSSAGICRAWAVVEGADSGGAEMLGGACMVAAVALATLGVWRWLDGGGAPGGRATWPRLAALALAALALVPLLLPAWPAHVLVAALGGELHRVRGLPVQLLELRLYPAVAVALLLAAAALLGGVATRALGQVAMCAGLGLAGWSLLRRVVQARPSQPVWGWAGQELVLLVVVVVVVLAASLPASWLAVRPQEPEAR